MMLHHGNTTPCKMLCCHYQTQNRSHEPAHDEAAAWEGHWWLPTSFSRGTLPSLLEPIRNWLKLTTAGVQEASISWSTHSYMTNEQWGFVLLLHMQVPHGLVMDEKRSSSAAQG